MVKLFDNDSYISINFTSNNVKSTSKGNIEFQDDYVMNHNDAIQKIQFH